MATVPMWWARNSVSGQVPAGLRTAWGPGGLGVSGIVLGPASGFMSLGEASHSFGLLSQFWLSPGNDPGNMCQVDSTPLAIMSGEIAGATFGGIFPFGPWPVTTCELYLIQRVSSRGIPLETRSLMVPLVSIVDTEFLLTNVALPSPSAFPTIRFDLRANPNLTIDTVLLFRIFFRGTGSAGFSRFVTSPPFVVGVPQWNLVSVP